MDYVPGMRDVARQLMEVRRLRLTEARMFVSGLRTLAEVRQARAPAAVSRVDGDRAVSGNITSEHLLRVAPAY